MRGEAARKAAKLESLEEEVSEEYSVEVLVWKVRGL